MRAGSFVGNMSRCERLPFFGGLGLQLSALVWIIPKWNWFRIPYHCKCTYDEQAQNSRLRSILFIMQGESQFLLSDIAISYSLSFIHQLHTYFPQLEFLNLSTCSLGILVHPKYVLGY